MARCDVYHTVLPPKGQLGIKEVMAERRIRAKHHPAIFSWVVNLPPHHPLILFPHRRTAMGLVALSWRYRGAIVALSCRPVERE